MVQEQAIREHEQRGRLLPNDCRECILDLFLGPYPESSIFIPNTWAAACTCVSSITCTGLAAFQSTAMCEILGTTSLSSSKRFPSISTEIEVNPVAFPPGCARLATRPVATGSPTAIMTRGD
jgi:hypothetical protein